MSYVTDTMQKDEAILVTPKLHWVNYIVPYASLAGAAILAIIPFLFPLLDYEFWLFVGMFLIYGGYGILELKSREMAVTNKRVVMRRGIVASDGDEMKNYALTSIEVEQTVLGRIFNFGNLCFASVGSGMSVRLVFANVANPRALKAQIEDVIEGNN